MPEPWTEVEEARLAQHLIERVRDRAAGRLEDECLQNAPRDKYFLGNLRSLEAALAVGPDEPAHLQELLTKMAPVAFGADFRVRPSSGGTEAAVEVFTEVNWACYYRVFPTFEQQRAHQRRAAEEDGGGTDAAVATGMAPSYPAAASTNGAAAVEAATGYEPEVVEDPSLAAEQAGEEQRAEVESPEVAESRRDRRRARRPNTSDSLAARFRKIPCRTRGRILLFRGAEGTWTADAADLQNELDRETARAQAVALADPERIRTKGAAHERVRVPHADLVSAEQYAEFLRMLDTDVVPEWRWLAAATTRASEAAGTEETVLVIELTNRSPLGLPPRPAGQHPNFDSFLFDVGAAFTFVDGDVRPFTLELAPRGFRHDRDLWGRGFNCAVVRDPDHLSCFIALHTPVYRQMRYQTQTVPPAPFATLAANPLPTLDAVLAAMEADLAEWDIARAEHMAADLAWETRSGPGFAQERAQFAGEIARFRRGRDLIATNADVRLAFQLTNETFRRMGAHPEPAKAKTAWRLFQIVFLLTQIPGIAALADPASPDAGEREVVDIVYFATGGGKTEAYLATLVFHCFFDRLRGKTAGVTAWTRFPLRLLTIQQTQRMADVIGTAELVRREQAGELRLSGKGVAGFAVGYFVGKGGSPNELVNPEKYRYANAENRATWAKASDPEARQAWRCILACPSCRTKTVRLDLDEVQTRLVHRCTNPGCAFQGRSLPVYVVDNDSYRYLPSVLVGTIDKLASLGNQRKVATLFGAVDGMCADHGYYKGVCSQKGCEQHQLRAVVPPGLSGMTLFVQDELHLLKEGLGTFDGHYETFAQELRARLNGENRQELTVKIIASSATIEAFERQVEHLYKRDQARVFPGPGPRAGMSFYARTQDYPQRLFVGLIPHNKTIFNAVLELIEMYHREVQSLQGLPAGAPNPYGGAVAPGSDPWRELLDFYATSLTYFLANRELDSIRNDIEGDVDASLKNDGLTPLSIYTLTGGTETDEVSNVLDHLERPAPARPAADAVLATNMVSHGVDLDRLNAMLFYGMPRQTAEYIQASSRVGRSHVGIVLTCMHPARERDQSHYGYFLKYHEFLGQLVEPVAINRWAKFSIDRTLPGLFLAVLLQVHANAPGVSNPGRYYQRDFVRGLINRGELTEADFVPLLKAAYGVAVPTTAGEEAFSREIEPAVRRFLFDQIGGSRMGTDSLFDVLYPKPMNSLRDVDVAVPIELDGDGDRWASRSGGG